MAKTNACVQSGEKAKINEIAALSYFMVIVRKSAEYFKKIGIYEKIGNS